MSNRSLGSLTLDLIARTGGFEQGMDRAARTADKRMRDIERTAKKVGTAIGLAVTAWPTALSAAVKSAINRMDELSKASQRAGTSVEAFSQLAHAANLADVGMGDLVTSMGRLTKAQADALGGSKAQIKTFESLGIAFKTADGNLRASRDVLLDFADKFQQMKGSPEAIAAGFQLFGRSFQNLIPMLKDGRQGLQEAADEADRLGLTISGETARRAEEFNDNLTRLKGALEGVSNIIADRALPQLVAFTDQVKDPRNQEALRSTAVLIGDMTAGLFGFTQKLVEAGGAYRNWVAEMGALPANALSTAEQLETRIKKLSEMQYGSGILNDIRRGIFGDKIGEELRKAVGELNAFGFRGVTSSVSSTEALPGVVLPPSEGGGGGGGGGKKTRALPDFSKQAASDLQAMMDKVAAARDRFDAMAATLAGPVAEANFRYRQDLKELNELAKVGEINTADLAKAQANLAKEHERNIESINRMLDPIGTLIEDIEFENALMGLGNVERQMAIATRGMEAEAIEGQSEKLAELREALTETEEHAKQIRLMDGMRAEFESFFTDVITGNKSLKDSFEDMLESIGNMIARRIAENWVDQLFGAPGSSQGGSAGGWFATFASWFSKSGFASGGYTGSGGKHDPAGIVHAGEFVIQADAVRRIGLPLLETLNQLPGYDKGGLVQAYINERGKEGATLHPTGWLLTTTKEAA